MKPVQPKKFHHDIVQRLCGIATSDTTISTDQVAQVRAFLANFQRFAQTPNFIHLALQNEFHFEYILDTYPLRDAPGAELDAVMIPPWPDALFGVVDHSCIDTWTKRIVQKWQQTREKPHTRWAFLVPAKTSTSWFHQDILSHATELRFLRGSTFIPSSNPEAVNMRPEDHSDSYCIAIFDRRHVTAEQKRPKHSPVSIITLTTSFSDTANVLEIKPLQDGNVSS